MQILLFQRRRHDTLNLPVFICSIILYTEVLLIGFSLFPNNFFRWEEYFEFFVWFPSMIFALVLVARYPHATRKGKSQLITNIVTDIQNIPQITRTVLLACAIFFSVLASLIGWLFAMMSIIFLMWTLSGDNPVPVYVDVLAICMSALIVLIIFYASIFFSIRCLNYFNKRVL